MPYFPFFVNIKNSPCLVVGGGVVALRKIEKLLPFEPKITVVASSACGEIKALAQNTPKELLTLEERPFRDDDISGSLFVIAATGDERLNKHISDLCRKQAILCNAVDSPENCTFYFPALVTRGEACIGVSTAGKSPTLAGRLRRLISESIPDETALICELMGKLRENVLENIPTEAERKSFMAKALDACLELCETDESKLSELTPSQLYELTAAKDAERCADK